MKANILNLNCSNMCRAFCPFVILDTCRHNFAEKMWRFAPKFPFDLRQPITRWNRNRRWETSETGIPERHSVSVFQTFPAEMIMLSPQRAHLTATSEDLKFIDVYCRTSASRQSLHKICSLSSKDSRNRSLALCWAPRGLADLGECSQRMDRLNHAHCR